MTIEETLTYICTALGGSLITAIGLYITTSFKKSAEIDIISSNIEEIIQQQKLTAVTEQVKVDIEHRIWKKKESEQLLKEKIEEYYICIGNIPNYMADNYEKVMFDGTNSDDVIARSRIIAHLYLPMIIDKHKELDEVLAEYLDYIVILCQKKINAEETIVKEDLEKFSQIRNKAMPLIKEIQHTLATKVNNMINVE